MSGQDRLRRHFIVALALFLAAAVLRAGAEWEVFFYIRKGGMENILFNGARVTAERMRQLREFVGPPGFESKDGKVTITCRHDANIGDLVSIAEMARLQGVTNVVVTIVWPVGTGTNGAKVVFPWPVAETINWGEVLSYESLTQGNFDR